MMHIEKYGWFWGSSLKLYQDFLFRPQNLQHVFFCLFIAQMAPLRKKVKRAMTLVLNRDSEVGGGRFCCPKTIRKLGCVSIIQRVEAPVMNGKHVGQ